MWIMHEIDNPQLKMSRQEILVAVRIKTTNFDVYHN